MIGITILLFILTSLFYIYFKRVYTFWDKLNVPSPTPRIPMGNFVHLIGDNLGTQLKPYYDSCKAMGHRYFGVYSINTPIFVPVDLDLVKEIMAKSFHHFIDRGMYTNAKDSPLSQNLFTIGEEGWKRLRVKMTPAFSSGKLKMMVPCLMECQKGLQKHIENCQKNGLVIDMKDSVGKATTDSIGSVAFGIQCDSFKNPNSQFMKNCHRALYPDVWYILMHIFGVSFPSLAKKLHVVSFPPKVERFFCDVVENSMKYRKENNIERNDFLQLMIKLYDEGILNLNEVTAMAFAIFLAGYDTTASAVTFCMFELAQHQNIQNRVRAEIRESLAKHNGKITYETLKELPFTEQVILETLRKYPPLGVITRKCVQAYNIPGTKIEIPRGTKIFIPTIAIHYDPKYYPDPNKFDPERFNPTESNGRNQFSNLSFGEGPRMCIGQRLGMMGTKINLITLLENYSYTLNSRTSPEIKFRNSLILASKEKLLFDVNKAE